jgi:hypothetical protein
MLLIRATTAAAMAGDRLMPPPQLIKVGILAVTKRTAVLIAASTTAGEFPCPSTKGKRQSISSLGTAMGDSSRARSIIASMR